jgi:hypothetical protein
MSLAIKPRPQLNGEWVIVTVQLDVRRASGPAASDAAPRVVITRDFIETNDGAERVTAEIAIAFPRALVVAILGRREVAKRMGIADRFRSLLPERQVLLRDYRYLTPVLGAYTDGVRVEEADVVLSSSYAFADRLRSRNDAPIDCSLFHPSRRRRPTTITCSVAG